MAVWVSGKTSLSPAAMRTPTIVAHQTARTVARYRSGPIQASGDPVDSVFDRYLSRRGSRLRTWVRPAGVPARDRQPPPGKHSNKAGDHDQAGHHRTHQEENLLGRHAPSRSRQSRSGRLTGAKVLTRPYHPIWCPLATLPGVTDAIAILAGPPWSPTLLHGTRMNDLPPVRRVARRPSAALAAALSFVLPGLGQAYAGRARLGLLFAAPLIVLAGMVLAGFLLGPGCRPPGAGRARRVDGPARAQPGTAAVAAARDRRGGTHAASAHGSRSRATTAVVVLLMLLTMAMHTWLATATLAADRALAQIFNPPVGTRARAAGLRPPRPHGPGLPMGRHRAGEHPAHRLRQRPRPGGREHRHPAWWPPSTR